MAALLPNLVRDRGWEIQLDMHSVFARWPEVVDETTAAHARPQKIVRGVLWVEVENSAWLQQLQYQRHVLLESINGFLEKSQIQEIRLTLPEKPDKPVEEKGAVRFAAPQAAEIESFEQQIAFIDDADCRQALMRFWYLTRACQRDDE